MISEMYPVNWLINLLVLLGGEGELNKNLMSPLGVGYRGIVVVNDDNTGNLSPNNNQSFRKNNMSNITWLG